MGWATVPRSLREFNTSVNPREIGVPQDPETEIAEGTNSNDLARESTLEHISVLPNHFPTSIRTPSLCDANSGAYMHIAVVMPLLKSPAWETRRSYSKT